MVLKTIIYIISVLVVIVATIAIAAVSRKTKKLNKVSTVLYELLPLYDCKECGRTSCMAFAEDLSKGKTMPSMCPYLKGKKYLRVRQILKRERKVKFNYVAFVKCKGGIDCEDKFLYIGDSTCSSKNLLHSGDKVCPFACLGCGDCRLACKYDAIYISKKGCAVIDKNKCVGCGECVSVCPNHLIEMVPSKKFVEVVCKNSSKDPNITSNCSVACTHCEACVQTCPNGAISMVGGLPKIDEKKCIKCGKCVAICPEHVISRI